MDSDLLLIFRSIKKAFQEEKSCFLCTKTAETKVSSAAEYVLECEIRHGGTDRTGPADGTTHCSPMECHELLMCLIHRAQSSNLHKSLHVNSGSFSPLGLVRSGEEARGEILSCPPSLLLLLLLQGVRRQEVEEETNRSFTGSN